MIDILGWACVGFTLAGLSVAAAHAARWLRARRYAKWMAPALVRSMASGRLSANSLTVNQRLISGGQ